MSEIRVPALSGSDEDPLLGCRLLVVSSSGGKRGKELSAVPFIRALIPFTRAPLS